MSGWIGVDFDGTLAKYATWVGPGHCGEPVTPMVERVKRWLAEGREVRIFTARCWPLTTPVQPDDVLPPITPAAGSMVVDRYSVAAESVEAIRQWCRQHIGQVLTITCVKDYSMVELWDDRAVQVRPNTGEVVGHSTRGLS